MEIQVYQVAALPEGYWPIWEQIYLSCPEFESPYFSPEFAKAVGAVRKDTEVGVLIQAGQPVGFFPFHRGFMGVGQPLGCHLSDFQAVIAFPDAQWTPEELICGCGLAGWDFDHLLASTKGFERFSPCTVGSPFIDLSNGFDGYEKDQKARGSKKTLAGRAYSARKLQREVGPLRLEYHRNDPILFDQMVNLKKDQYKRTGVADVFSKNWTVALLKRIIQTQTANFAGVFSVLWAGDRAIAVHLGMRSRAVWHCWFATYDRSFSQYSPGMLLFIEMAKAAEAHNLKKMDFGKGEFDYKMRLTTGTTAIREGSIIVSAPIRWTRNSWRVTNACLRGALRHPARLVRKWIKRSHVPEG
jgi:CelD/BcsL family acetyltransferase involved in cellulose biosynthesis